MYLGKDTKAATTSGVLSTDEVIEVVSVTVAKAPLLVAKNYESLSNHYNHF